ncbi:MAG TPA: uracil-xanthine permease [Candidatus Merdivicinus excrementipullorum]|uniref:Uracil-xanthine permease n=1 Tax=Candidatus Merdivicinus excrementipullorum TaxID=2840867 RepID=A0A9D1FP09_9FIRM|nr:uracil-xanthine permease [Candidatus Merdivicinus excrementipullorum]
MKKTKTAAIGAEGLFDARQLGIPRMILLGIQHTFAMFGATVLVPIITGLDVSTTLLMAGLGTLLFHLITKGKVPAFLGSSFAFLGGFAAVAPRLEDGSSNLEMLPYACGGVVAAGLVYVVLSALIAAFGIKRVMRFFPPVVTGPIIISIGLILSPNAVSNASTNWLLAVVALAVIIICNIWGRGMVKIIPIILGIVISYAVALCMSQVDFTAIREAQWIGLPVHRSAMAKFDLNAILMIMPIALATIMEHIGDMAAISATTGKNYIADPGLSRTLLGDGLATSMAGFLGGPANTTYGENTGVLAMTRIYDPRVMRIAACFAILLSFSPKIGAVIETIPTAIIGGISIILYGMISAVGVRNIVENRVDFTKTRNLVIAAVILVSALGINFAFENNGISFAAGDYTITLSGLAVAAILGIVLNAIIPGNDYEFGKEEEGEQSVSFKV